MSYAAPLKDMLFVMNELAGLAGDQSVAGLRRRDSRNGAKRYSKKMRAFAAKWSRR